MFLLRLVGRNRLTNIKNPINATSVVPKSCLTVFIEEALPMNIVHNAKIDNRITYNKSIQRDKIIPDDNQYTEPIITQYSILGIWSEKLMVNVLTSHTGGTPLKKETQDHLLLLKQYLYFYLLYF